MAAFLLTAVMTCNFLFAQSERQSRQADQLPLLDAVHAAHKYTDTQTKSRILLNAIGAERRAKPLPTLGSRWQSLACSLVAGFRLKPNGPELCMPHVALDDVGIPILYMPPPTLDSFFVDAASQLYCLMVFPLFCLPLPQSLSLHFGTAFKWLRQQSGKLYLRSHSHIECSVI